MTYKILVAFSEDGGCMMALAPHDSYINVGDLVTVDGNSELHKVALISDYNNESDLADVEDALGHKLTKVVKHYSNSEVKWGEEE